ncbi:uncharacterized protein LOC135370074 [Ornithodoros turicata]|uniref:uncharacterized protein LOC135370074 n=1 Tax=Ornithodoros turicata TaxID=34597 RepID=UPI003138AB3F
MDELSIVPNLSSMSGLGGGTQGAEGTITFTEETPQELRERKRHFVRMGSVVIIVLLVLNVLLLYVYLTSKPKVMVKRHTEYLGHVRGLHGEQPASKQTLPAVVECHSPGCQWLQQYLRSIPRKVEPCQDFYAHACDGVDVDLMTRGVVKFMQATGDVILRSAARYEEGQHASVFNNCIQAR